MAQNNDKRVDMTTGIGTLSFPHVFKETASKDKKTGADVYEIQIIIPKTQREDVQALLAAVKAVAQAKWGENWKAVKNPLRDGDKEAKMLAEDGSTRGEKYPERLGCYFFNARSKKPVGVVDRDKTLINEPAEIYGGCKGRLNITLYPFNTEGNQGVGVGLNGVQKHSDGEPFGAARQSVESMFDMLDDDNMDDDGLGDEKPKKSKKSKAKAAPEPEPEVETKAKKKKKAKV